MSHRKWDAKVSPSDEEAGIPAEGTPGIQQSEELPLVEVKPAGEGETETQEKTRNGGRENDEGGRSSRVKAARHSQGLGNFGFFGDDPSVVQQHQAPTTSEPGTSRSSVPTVAIQEPDDANGEESDKFYGVAQLVVNRKREAKREQEREEAAFSVSRNVHSFESSSQLGDRGYGNRERKTSTSYPKRRMTQNPNDLLREFVMSNVKQRRCRTFIEDSKWSSTDKSIAMCCCGRSLSDHRGHVTKASGEWKVETCTVAEPATSFGQIEFVGYGQGRKRAPYARIDYKTNPEIIWKLLTEHWRLKPPNVLISVTGGAKDFVLKDRLRALLHKGLMKAATSTGAWIITGGTAEGVMKVVGEAVHEEAKEHTHDDEKPVYALGIATWGIVDNKEALDGSKKHINLWPATYPAEGLRSMKNSAALDCNHTHFILVDNGTIGKYGADIELRAALEKYIADEKYISEKQVGDPCTFEPPNERVPVVLVVVEGGPNTLKTVYETTEKNMPAVIIEGSGRAADVIAYAFKKTKPTHTDSNISRNVDREDIRQRVIKTFNLDQKDPKVEQFIDWVQACIKKRNLITVFRIQDADNRDIDGAILHAMLHARSGSAQTQLNLALAWNRSDIARQEIFAPERRMEWQKIAMEEAMLTALTLDRVDFVQLLMDHGIVLKNFLTIKRLHQLYFQALYAPKDFNEDTTYCTVEMIKTQIQSIKQSMSLVLDDGWARYLLHFVGKLLTTLMGDEYPLSYSNDIFVVDPFECSIHGSTPEEKSLSAQRDNFRFDYPEQELYMWAILLNRKNMARLFWQNSTTHIGGSLVAAKLLREMSKIAESEEELELHQDLINHSMDYQMLGKDVLTECYNKEKKKSQLLVVRELPNWGHTTCLSIADSAFLMEFMDHSCCQTKLNRIWKGKMHLHTSWWRLLLAMIPFLIFLVRFSAEDEELEDMEKTPEKQAESLSGANNNFPSPVRPQLQKRLTTLSTSDQVYSSQTPRHQHSRKIRKLGWHTVENRLSIFRAIWYYYTAPVTKFMFNVLSYIIFLVIFSYFMLTDLYPISHPDSPGIWEWITIAWVFSLTIEEGRQILVREPKSLRYKIISWYDDIWNRFDLVMISMFSVSLILRFSLEGDDFMVARIGYSLTLMVFMFRLVHMGFFHKEIGPKIIMIKQMLEDLVYFVGILIIFIMAFGVACEALLYPNHHPSFMLIPKVIYKPYWQMYGELFLEEIEGRLDNETCYAEPRLDGHCPPMDDTYRWVVPLLTAVYMLISNVLLLNLLIAMFSYIFQKVNDKSETIWRFYRYELVYEYFDRPTLIPPLILLNHLWRILWWIIYRCSGQEPPSTSFKVRLDEDEIAELNSFERRQVENYYIKKHHRDNLIPEVRMQKTGQRLDKVIEEIEDIRDCVSGRWTESQAIGMLVRGDSTRSIHDAQRRRPLTRRAITDSMRLKDYDRCESVTETVPESEAGTTIRDDLEERVERMETHMSDMMSLLRSMQSTQEQLLEEQKQGRTVEKTTEVHYVPVNQTAARQPQARDPPVVHEQRHHAPPRYTQPAHRDDRDYRQPYMIQRMASSDGSQQDLLQQYLPQEVTFREQLLRGAGSPEMEAPAMSREQSVESQLSYREQLLQGTAPNIYSTYQSDDSMSVPERADHRPKLRPSASTLREQLLQGLASTPSGLRPSDESSLDTSHGY